MASTNYASVLATTIAQAAGWKELLAAELVANPPLLSQRERETLTALALTSPYPSGSWESLITTRAVVLADNGKTFGLNLAAGFTTTLPLGSTLPVGWWCEFYVMLAPTGDYVVAANATDVDKILGHVLSSSGAAEDTAAIGDPGDVITFIAAAGAGKAGDYLKVKWDGTYWHARGECATAAGLLITG